MTVRTEPEVDLRDSHSTPCRHVGPCNDWTHPKTLDELIAERETPPLTWGQIVEEWGGLFEPEFWEEVRSARRAP